MFNEIVDAELDDIAKARRIAYMIDQSHNIEPKNEAMIQSVITSSILRSLAVRVSRDFDQIWKPFVKDFAFARRLTTEKLLHG